MKRYYVAPVVHVQDPVDGDMIRPALPLGLTAVYALDERLGWGLVLVDAADHTSLLAMPSLVALADFPLDAKLSALGSSVKSAMVQGLQTKFGITVDTTGVDAYRDLVRQLGRKVDPNFNENAFDVHAG